MTSRARLVSAILVVLALGIVLASAQTASAQYFRYPEFYAGVPFPPAPPAPPAPPVPPLPPLPPFEYQDFHFEFGPYSGGRSVDPEVALKQEVFRSLLRTAPDRALDIAAERLKADPADPVVLANLPTIANTTSSKALPLLVTIAKTSSNMDARRSAVSALARVRDNKDGLKTLEDLYNSSADNVDLRRVIVQSIARSSDAGAVALLGRIAKNDADISIRRTAARSLGNRDEADVNKLLEELLRPTK
jgi:hypothetical protein